MKNYFIIVLIMVISSCNSRDSNSTKIKASNKSNLDEQYSFEELIDMSFEELRIKRNEVYAKKGRKFKSKDLQEYFEQFDWYKPQYDNVNEKLSDIDNENIRKVIKAENLLKASIIYADKPIESSNNYGQSVIKMTKFGGVYHIPVSINGTEMFFIFDTGASIISISNTEALFLFKQGKLQEEDIIGEQNFFDAKGEISKGTIINLKKVEIGDFVLTNVEASVVDNLEAPLLLGQTALSRFGNVQIDYNNETLIIKK